LNTQKTILPFFLEMFNSIMHDNILRHFIVHGHSPSDTFDW